MAVEVKPKKVTRMRDLIEITNAGGDLNQVENNIRLSEVYQYYKENPDGLLPLSEIHRASEFSAFLQRGVRTLLLGGYQEGPDVWKQVISTQPSDGPFETYPNLGTLETPRRREPNEGFPRLSFASEDVRVTNLEYGGLVEIDQTLIEDDQTAKIRTQPTLLGRAHARLLNETTFGVINDNGSIYDAALWFATGGHPNRTGGAVVATNTNHGSLGTISEVNLETALAEIMLWRGLQGEIINVDPVILLYSPADFAVVERILSPYRHLAIGSAGDRAAAIGPAGSNIHSGRLRPVMSKWLTSGTWYIWTTVTGFVHQERIALDVAQELTTAGLSFEMAAWRFRSRTRWGQGIVDWRQGYKGN